MVAVNDVLLDTSATDRIVQEGKLPFIFQNIQYGSYHMDHISFHYVCFKLTITFSRYNHGVSWFITRSSPCCSWSNCRSYAS